MADRETFEAYGVFDPAKRLLVSTVRRTFAEATDAAEAGFGDEWFSIERMGYTVRRVLIREASSHE